MFLLINVKHDYKRDIYSSNLAFFLFFQMKNPLEAALLKM